MRDAWWGAASAEYPL